jgi:WD40 repeat protein
MSFRAHLLGAMVVAVLLAAAGRTWLRLHRAAPASAAGARVVPGPPAPAMAPTGTPVASADGAAIRMLDTATGRELWRYENRGIPSEAVAFSPDGQRVACSLDGQAVSLLDAHSPAILATFPAIAKRLATLLFAADGKRLYGTFQDGSLGFWDLATGAFTAFPSVLGSGHSPGLFYSMVRSPRGDQLAVGGPQHITVWSLGTGKPLMELTPSARVGSRFLRYSPDGAFIIGFESILQATVWDARTGAELRRAQQLGLASYFPWSAFTPDHRFLLTEHGRAHGLCIRDGGSLKILWTSEALHLGSCRWAALSPDGTHLVGSMGVAPEASAEQRDLGRLVFWDRDSKAILAQVSAHHGPVTCVALAPDGRLAASGGVDGLIKVWDFPQGLLRAELKGHLGAITELGFANARTLYSVSEDETVRTWDLDGKACTATLPLPPKVGSAILYAPADLCAWQTPGGIEIRDLRRSVRVARHEIDAGSFAFAEAGHSLAISDEQGHIRLLDPVSGRLQFQFQERVPGPGEELTGRTAKEEPQPLTNPSLRVSADGKLLLALRPGELGPFEGSYALVWDLTTRHLVFKGELQSAAKVLERFPWHPGMGGFTWKEAEPFASACEALAPNGHFGLTGGGFRDEE